MGFVSKIFGGSSKAPKPPDPYQTAAAQSGMNREAIREAALHNQINQARPTRQFNVVGSDWQSWPHSDHYTFSSAASLAPTVTKNTRRSRRAYTVPVAASKTSTQTWRMGRTWLARSGNAGRHRP